MSFSLEKTTADLFDKDAKEQADEIINAKDKMSMHQFRRFYGEVKNLERKTRANPGKFQEKYWPQFVMLKSKIKYQRSRKDTKVPEEFYNLFEEAIKQINGDKEKFYRFCLFLEAVLGFAAEKLRK